MGSKFIKKLDPKTVNSDRVGLTDVTNFLSDFTACQSTSQAGVNNVATQFRLETSREDFH